MKMKLKPFSFKSVGIKLFVLMIAPMLLLSCNNGLLKHDRYNIPLNKVDIDKFLLDKFKTYELTKTENDNYVNLLKGETGLTGFVNYSLKSKEPVRKDETGNYYYRWTISTETFNTYDEAVDAFNKKYKEYSEVNSVEGKGLNSRIIICDNTIYTLSAGCLEGWHVKEWFAILLKELIGNAKPQKNTVISCDCGGNISINNAND